MPKDKIGIVGLGRVGSSIAFSTMLSGVVEELVLLDVDQSRAEGEAMDLAHALPYMPTSNVYAGTYDDLKDTEVIVVAAGTARRPGETRLDLASRNYGIAKEITTELQKIKDAVILVVSNPVDVITTYMSKKLDPNKTGKVFGSGTALDTARFRYIIADQFKVDAHNVHAYMIGEHGDSQVPIWSSAKIALIDIDKYPNPSNAILTDTLKDEIYQAVVKAGAEVIKRKGATHFGIAQVTNYLVNAILRDQNSILCVSTIPHGEYGINDVALSLPALVGNCGACQRIVPVLSDKEVEALNSSAEKLRSMCRELGIL